MLPIGLYKVMLLVVLLCYITVVGSLQFPTLSSNLRMASLESTDPLHAFLVPRFHDLHLDDDQVIAQSMGRLNVEHLMPLQHFKTSSLLLLFDPSQAVSNQLSSLDEVIQQQGTNTGGYLDQLYHQVIETFFVSLESRVIGAIVGNILAGFVFKWMIDFVSNLAKSKAKSIKEDFDDNIASFMPPSKSEYIPPRITKEAWAKLLVCILIDAVSDSSFILPGIGEVEDVAWAPISALLMKNLFDSNSVASIEFVKEILPFTDIIPLACSVWLLENVFTISPLTKLLQLKPNKKQTNHRDDKRRKS